MGLARTWSVSASASCAAEDRSRGMMGKDGRSGEFHGENMGSTWKNMGTYRKIWEHLENIREDDGK